MVGLGELDFDHLGKDGFPPQTQRNIGAGKAPRGRRSIHFDFRFIFRVDVEVPREDERSAGHGITDSDNISLEGSLKEIHFTGRESIVVNAVNNGRSSIGSIQTHLNGTSRDDLSQKILSGREGGRGQSNKRLIRPLDKIALIQQKSHTPSITAKLTITHKPGGEEDMSPKDANGSKKGSHVRPM